ncbi:hypothetical protein HJC23_000703 [Cyclotella cryptica]|uniref:Uncharacterized protein n=1 Tax=Cyclotella cryptica TaxID=29204 RepID=A0ABD3QFN7_9STRA|eukprot:CCRYP_007384-RA/>CCRYP_007384-RA protein AED:0.00 eAED:0.00 QI:397/-1/1/1/-1/1/1/999/519
MNMLTRIGRREAESRSESAKKIGKERSITPRRIGKKYTGDEGRVCKPSDTNPDDSTGHCEPSGQLIGQRGVTFAGEQSEIRSSTMPCSGSHSVQPQHIGSNDNDSNCESTPSLSSSQNAVFAFYSQSQSSEATTPKQSSVSPFFGSCAANTTADENSPQDFSPKVKENWRSNQQKKYHTDNCALETTNDKIDEDALSAWWFLGSKSESFEDASYNKRQLEPSTNDVGEVQRQQVKLEKEETNGLSCESNKRSESRMSWILQSFSGEKSPSIIFGGNRSSGSLNDALELAERKSPSAYIQHTNSYFTSDENKGVGKTRSSMQARHLQGISESNDGAGYTLKEQRIRREWLVAMGGTVNYDRSAHIDSGDSLSVASYQLVLPQKSTLQIDTKSSMCNDLNKSPDWDPSMLQMYQKMKKPYFEDWTPQDSSYGAAVPAFGFIPKRIRKLIEIVFLLLVTAVLIYVVVKLGIILIGNEHSSSAGGGDLVIWNDDDHYISNNANNNMNQGAADDNDRSIRLQRK